MTLRMTIAAVGAAAALTAAALPVAAQDAHGSVEAAAVAKTSSGEVVVVVGEDGRTHYVLQLEDGTQVELSFGPAWFWGPLSPFDAMVGTTVEIGGQVAVVGPDEHASASGQEHAANKPKLHARTVDGSPLRSHGKPPWAGGPKVLGEAHPGHADWSKGQAARAANAAKAHAPDAD